MHVHQEGHTGVGNDLYVSTFFVPGFPNIEGMLNLWLAALGREGFVPSSSTAVCSRHFAEEHIIRGKKRIWLKPTAVPLRPALRINQEDMEPAPSHAVKTEDNHGASAVPVVPCTRKRGQKRPESWQCNAHVISKLKKTKQIDGLFFLAQWGHSHITLHVQKSILPRDERR